MKKWFLALLPWMACTALTQSEGPRPAEVFFPHAKIERAPAWQIGVECFVSTDLLEQAGWSVNVKNGEVTVNADGKRATVPYRTQSGKHIVAFGPLLAKIGAGGEWVQGTGTYSVYGYIRSVRIERDMLMVDSTLPTQPKIASMSEPGRLVFDFENMRFDDKTILVLPEEARAGQFQPNTARVVIETDLRPDTRPSKLQRSKNFTFNYGIPADPNSMLPEELQGGEKPLEIGSIPQPATISNNELLGPPTVIMDTDSRTVLEFRFSQPLGSTPQIRRPNVHEFHLVLDRVRYTGTADATVSSSAVKEFKVEAGPMSSTAKLTFNRAVGVEFTQKGNVIQLILIRPKFADPSLATKTVVIDPGHGGKDGGANAPGGSVNEKTLALRISREVSRALTAEGATVIMTRDSDVFIPLSQRPEIANKAGADLFVSVHINSSGSVNSTSGTIVFYHKRDTIGKLLAECIATELAKTSKLKNLGAWSDQRIYDSGFAVLRGAGMPAVLLELGFINHSSDRGRMTQESYPSDVAKAVVKGIKVFLGNE